jgi:hypothetical protein
MSAGKVSTHGSYTWVCSCTERKFTAAASSCRSPGVITMRWSPRDILKGTVAIVNVFYMQEAIQSPARATSCNTTLGKRPAMHSRPA